MYIYILVAICTCVWILFVCANVYPKKAVCTGEPKFLHRDYDHSWLSHKDDFYRSLSTFHLTFVVQCLLRCHGINQTKRDNLKPRAAALLSWSSIRIQDILRCLCAFTHEKRGECVATPPMILDPHLRVPHFPSRFLEVKKTEKTRAVMTVVTVAQVLDSKNGGKWSSVNTRKYIYIYTHNTLRSTTYTQVFLQISFLLTASWRGTPVKPPAFPPFEWWLDPSGSDFPVGERAPAASSGAAPPAYNYIYMYVYIYMYILHQHQFPLFASDLMLVLRLHWSTFLTTRYEAEAWKAWQSNVWESRSAVSKWG